MAAAFLLGACDGPETTPPARDCAAYVEEVVARHTAGVTPALAPHEAAQHNSAALAALGPALIVQCEAGEVE